MSSTFDTNWTRYMALEREQIIAPRPVHFFARPIVFNLQAQVLANDAPVEIPAPVGVSTVNATSRPLSSTEALPTPLPVPLLSSETSYIVEHNSVNNDWQTSTTEPLLAAAGSDFMRDPTIRRSSASSTDASGYSTPSMYSQSDDDLKAYIRASLVAAMDDDSDLPTPPTSESESTPPHAEIFAWGARLPSDVADRTAGREFYAPHEVVSHASMAVAPTDTTDVYRFLTEYIAWGSRLPAARADANDARGVMAPEDMISGPPMLAADSDSGVEERIILYDAGRDSSFSALTGWADQTLMAEEEVEEEEEEEREEEELVVFGGFTMRVSFLRQLVCRDFGAPRHNALDRVLASIIRLNRMRGAVGLSVDMDVDGRDELASVAGGDENEDVEDYDAEGSVADSVSAGTYSSEDDETVAGYDADDEAEKLDGLASHVSGLGITMESLLAASGFWVSGTRY